MEKPSGAEAKESAAEIDSDPSGSRPRRAASPAGPRRAAAPAEGAQVCAGPGDRAAGELEAGASEASTYRLAGWIALLCVAQLAMFIYTKRAAQLAALPLCISLAQFGVSAALTAIAAAATSTGVTMMEKEHRASLVPLGVVWTLGFVLLTAAVARMSAALAGVVRSMEPLASVLLGLLLGERYSAKVLSALVPVCGGAFMASKGGGQLSTSGLGLAVLSNFAFCSRPFLAKRLRTGPGRPLDDASVFFNVTLIGTCTLALTAVPAEGAALAAGLASLRESGQVTQFAMDILLNSVSFFLYQFAQLRVMSELAPLSFSVLTPTSKAAMIVACAAYFGDPFGASNVLGLLLLTSGVLSFTLARRSDAQAAAKQGEKKQ